MADSNEFYLKLITSEHATSKNFISYTKATLDMVSPMIDALNSFDDLFNLDYAVGSQLDDIGILVGITRVLPTSVTEIDPVLDDATFRRIIKAKILRNHWDGTLQGMMEIMNVLYKNLPYIIYDHQDMTITVYITDPTISVQDKALLFNGFILPKPSGVLMNYEILDSALFSWDMDHEHFKGWDEGTWA